MTKVGIVGIGDMGSGIAKNLMASGFEVCGLDLDKKRMRAFTEAGGIQAKTLAEVGKDAQAVFVMVMTGAQAEAVILGEAGLAAHMPQGASIILTATIKPAEAEQIAHKLASSAVHLIDSPVSGGFPGAQSGSLTMMAAGSDDALTSCREIMEAVSATIHIVGDAAPKGQMVKACLQSIIGSVFSLSLRRHRWRPKRASRARHYSMWSRLPGQGAGLRAQPLKILLTENSKAQAAILPPCTRI